MGDKNLKPLLRSEVTVGPEALRAGSIPRVMFSAISTTPLRGGKHVREESEAAWTTFLLLQLNKMCNEGDLKENHADSEVKTYQVTIQKGVRVLKGERTIEKEVIRASNIPSRANSLELDTDTVEEEEVELSLALGAPSRRPTIWDVIKSLIWL